AELAHQEDVEGQLEPPRYLEGHGYAAAGQGEHHGVGVSFEREQIHGELGAGISAIAIVMGHHRLLEGRSPASGMVKLRIICRLCRAQRWRPLRSLSARVLENHMTQV